MREREGQRERESERECYQDEPCGGGRIGGSMNDVSKAVDLNLFRYKNVHQEAKKINNE